MSDAKHDRDNCPGCRHIREVAARTGHAEWCECCLCMPELCFAASERDKLRAALRDLVEAHSALRPLKEQDRLIVDALDRARALLQEADRG